MKTVAFLFFATLLAACAPADYPPGGTPVPPSCVTNVPCEADSDCGAGTRCNTRLPSPRCQNVQCGPDGSPCSRNALCESRQCTATAWAPNREGVCVRARTEVRPYDLCEGLPIGALCGMDLGYESGSHWECRNDLGLPGGAAQCIGSSRTGACPPGPNGEPSRDILVPRASSFACHFECVDGQCPSGYTCSDVNYSTRFCLPTPVR